MRALLTLAVATLGLLSGSALTWWWLDRHAPTASPAAVSPSADQQVLYWYDPMKPEQRFDRPGKSPYMDMPLVPKYAGDGGVESGVVSIAPAQVQNLGVRTARVSTGSLTSLVRATGTVAFDERQVSTVQARVAGIVERLVVRAPLSSVRRGEPLLTLIAPEWTAAQEEYLSLRRSGTQGLESLRAAARQRLLLLGMDESQIRSLENRGKTQTVITVTSPRDGVVRELAVRDGASVMAGAPLMQISGLDTVWIHAAIPEAQAGGVLPGAKVTATLSAFPGETFDGKVDSVLPDLDAETRTQTARIVLDNPGHRLAPGMFARVTATSAEREPAVLVPSESVIATGTRSVVIVALAKGRFRAQEVRTGMEANGQTEILDGLGQGEEVVLSGQFLIDSEASLNGALARLDGAATLSVTTAAGATPASGSQPEHVATGTLKAVDGTRWSIATDAIASLDMPAMAMEFVVPARLAIAAVRPGQRVSFRFVRNGDGDFEIVHLDVQPAVPEAHVHGGGAP